MFDGPGGDAAHEDAAHEEAPGVGGVVLLQEVEGADRRRRREARRDERLPVSPGGDAALAPAPDGLLPPVVLVDHRQGGLPHLPQEGHRRLAHLGAVRPEAPSNDGGALPFEPEFVPLVQISEGRLAVLDVLPREPRRPPAQRRIRRRLLRDGAALRRPRPRRMVRRDRVLRPLQPQRHEVLVVPPHVRQPQLLVLAQRLLRVRRRRHCEVSGSSAFF
mmetsp:Transcript_18623/g.60196  ORF Transcript_18623/g.60196 Transcript_18623/m.60196 type:complete len:218 (-) Transcript_18623:52-705(-)